MRRMCHASNTISNSRLCQFFGRKSHIFLVKGAEQYAAAEPTEKGTGAMIKCPKQLQRSRRHRRREQIWSKKPTRPLLPMEINRIRYHKSFQRAYPIKIFHVINLYAWAIVSTIPGILCVVCKYMTFSVDTKRFCESIAGDCCTSNACNSSRSSFRAVNRREAMCVCVCVW